MKRTLHFSGLTGRDSAFDPTGGELDKLLHRQKDVIDHQYAINWGTQERHKPNAVDYYKSGIRERLSRVKGMSKRQFDEYEEVETRRSLMKHWLHPKDNVLSTNRDSSKIHISFTKADRRLGAPSDTEANKGNRSRSPSNDGRMSPSETTTKLPEIRKGPFADVTGHGKHLASPYSFSRTAGRDGLSPMTRKEKEQIRKLREKAETAPLPEINDDTEKEASIGDLGEHLFPQTINKTVSSMARSGSTGMSLEPDAEQSPGKPGAKPVINRHTAQTLMLRLEREKEIGTRHLKAPLFRSYPGRSTAPMHQPQREVLHPPTLLNPESGLKIAERSGGSRPVKFTQARRFDQVFTGDDMQNLSVRPMDGVGVGKARKQSKVADLEATVEGSLSATMRSEELGSSQVRKKKESKKPKKPRKSPYRITNGNKIEVDVNIIFSSNRFKELLRENERQLLEINEEPTGLPATYDDAVDRAEKAEAVRGLRKLHPTKDDVAYAYKGDPPPLVKKSVPDLFLGPPRFDAATGPGAGEGDQMHKQPHAKKNRRIVAEVLEAQDALLEGRLRDKFKRAVDEEEAQRREEREEGQRKAVDAAKKRARIALFQKENKELSRSNYSPSQTFDESAPSFERSLGIVADDEASLTGTSSSPSPLAMASPKHAAASDPAKKPPAPASLGAFVWEMNFPKPPKPE